MNIHDILTDEELKMLLLKEADIDNHNVISHVQNKPTFIPRSMRHKKKKSLWDKLFKKTPV